MKGSERIIVRGLVEDKQTSFMDAFFLDPKRGLYYDLNAPIIGGISSLKQDFLLRNGA